MNALKILDSLINEAINNVNINEEDTESIDLTITKEKAKTTISGKVKISTEEGNGIIIKSDGIYHKVRTAYANGTLSLYINDVLTSQHILGLSSLVEDAYYDAATELS